MFKWLKISILVIMCLGGSSSMAQAIQQVYLIQNSGWMEPFYTDTQSQFKPLVGALKDATFREGDAASVWVFSQSTPTNESPKQVWSSKDQTNLATQMAALTLAHKNEHGVWADTDFKEAILHSVTQVFKGKPGIIWIVTNNKNSPNNDANTARLNQEFYNLLHNEPSINKVLAYPLKMPVKGKKYQASGLMIYALAYGNSAVDELANIIFANKFTQLITQASARLKPLNSDSIELKPLSVTGVQGASVSIGNDGKTILLRMQAGDFAPHLTLNMQVRNASYPYTIESANLHGSLFTPAQNASVEVKPAQMSMIEPNQTVDVQVGLNFPFAKVPSAWSVEALLGMGKAVNIPMQLKIELGQQKLVLGRDFTQHLQTLFPGDPISSVFTPNKSAQASVVVVPVVLKIEYPKSSIFIIVGMILLLLLGLLWLMWLFASKRSYTIDVNGMRRQFKLKRMERYHLVDENGVNLATIQRGLGQSCQVIESKDDVTIHFINS